jgi:hypothetical protein
MEKTKYRIKVDGLQPILCNITKTKVYNGTAFDYSIMIGGKSTYCFMGIIKAHSPTHVYIDRIEYNEACVEDGTLQERGGTAQLVIASLWTIVILFPNITQFDLIDDSNIYCKKDSKRFKLSLAYDYILKYNKTWYEKLFGAILPSYEITENGRSMTKYDIYKSQLAILDEPLQPYEIVQPRVNAIQNDKEEYSTAISPRDFINRLRHKYGDVYCFKVGGWLNGYMKFLGIKLYNEEWRIYTKDIKEPSGYMIEKIAINNIRGGRRKHFNKTIKKRIYKLKNFSLIKGGDSDSSMGYMSSFE